MILRSAFLASALFAAPAQAAPPPQHLFEVPLTGGLAPGEIEAGSTLIHRSGAYPPFFAEQRTTRRDEWRFSIADASIGLGGSLRLRLQAGWQRFEEEGGLEASGIEDLRLTFGGRLPLRLPVEIGLSFAAKLPNAAGEERLGTDQTDLLLRTTASVVRPRGGWAAAAGIGILGHPERAATQDDVLWIGLAGWGEAAAEPGRLRLLAEATAITTSRWFNDVRVLRAGIQIGARKGWGVHVMGRRGLTSVSEEWGAEIGLTWGL